MATKRDFKRIAEALVRGCDCIPDEKVKDIAMHLAIALRDTNPRFDKARFLDEVKAQPTIQKITSHD